MKVGYDVYKFLQSKGMVGNRPFLLPMANKKSLITKIMKRPMNFRAETRFQLPLTAGSAIGVFEMLFNTEAKFFVKGSSSGCNAFFISKVSYRRIVK